MRHYATAADIIFTPYFISSSFSPSPLILLPERRRFHKTRTFILRTSSSFIDIIFHRHFLFISRQFPPSFSLTFIIIT